MTKPRADSTPEVSRRGARAILGLYNSIWQWFRPNGAVALRRVAEFFIDRILAMIGVTPETKVHGRMVAGYRDAK